MKLDDKDDTYDGDLSLPKTDVQGNDRKVFAM
jgi:hypothetical protein